jgi:hypothetical protein
MPFHLVRAPDDFFAKNWHRRQKLTSHTMPLRTLAGADEGDARHGAGTCSTYIYIETGEIFASSESLQSGRQFFAIKFSDGQTILERLPTGA